MSTEGRVTLSDVTRENWYRCGELSVAEGQEGMVASNLVTIAESAFESHYRLRAISLDQDIIGMLAYCPEVDEAAEDLYWLFRLMIDRNYQNRGYARQAIQIALQEMRALGALRVKTMCRSENLAAIHLYQGLGFVPAGLLDDGDSVFEWAE